MLQFNAAAWDDPQRGFRAGRRMPRLFPIECVFRAPSIAYSNSTATSSKREHRAGMVSKWSRGDKPRFPPLFL
jgi:hypothetical protein